MAVYRLALLGMRLALFQPDQPPTVGTLVRLCACLGIGIDIIRPCGFPFGREALRRSALDYFDLAEVQIHDDWHAFQCDVGGRRVLLTTAAAAFHDRVEYLADDVLVVGRESAGVPDFVHAAAALRVRVPMRAGLRSINVALAAAMVAGEAMRQTGTYPQ